MKPSIYSIFKRITAQESFLWACLVVQLVLYWTCAFLIPSAEEFVAYQRY
jgi:hypothetical protein